MIIHLILYTLNLVEHFYYPEKIFKEIFRVLKPGGKIITLTPHWKFMSNFFMRTILTEPLLLLNQLMIYNKLVVSKILVLQF